METGQETSETARDGSFALIHSPPPESPSIRLSASAHYLPKSPKTPKTSTSSSYQKKSKRRRSSTSSRSVLVTFFISEFFSFAKSNNFIESNVCFITHFTLMQCIFYFNVYNFRRAQRMLHRVKFEQCQKFIF